MDFKILFLLSCMAICINGDDNGIMLSREVVEINQPSFDGSSDSYVNLIAEVTIADDDGKNYKYKMTLDTTTDSNWVASSSCNLHCPSCPSSALPTNKGDQVYADDNNVIGYKASYSVNIGEKTSTMDIVNANSVSRSLAQKISRSSNGVLSIFQAKLSGPQRILSLLTGGKSPALYVGIPKGKTKQQDLNTKPYAKINLHSDSEWNININFIRNSFGEWKTWCLKGCSGLIDSTFNGIAGPAEEIKSINAYIGTDDQGNIACHKANQLEPLYFFIDFHRYKLDAKHYITKNDDPFNPLCKSVFVVEKTTDTDWRLGLPMLDQYLTVLYVGDNKISLMELL